MSTHVVLPVERLPARLTLNPDRPMTDDEYFQFCALNEKVRLERTATGQITIAPPDGFTPSCQSADVVAQLGNWAELDGRGTASGSTTEFFLPTGAALSPDAAWSLNSRLAQFSKAEKRKFLHLSPDFVIEVMSPFDSLRTAKEKMTHWIAGGVKLGWLLHGDRQAVYVYRAGRKEQKHTGINKLAGEGPMAGFELDLTDIWTPPF